MCTPLPGKGFYHRGGNQATRPAYPFGANWPCPMVQLNRDAHHVPLPTDGHLSIMLEGSTSNIPCGRICHLVVCQLLSSGSEVVYLEGLNRCQIPVKTSLPESLSKGATMLEGKSALLQVDLLQFITKEQEFKVLSLGSGANTTLAASPTWASPPKVGSQASMTMEVSKLLSWVALDTSSQVSGGSTPKRPVSQY